jgi:hypothetical protein
MFKSRISKGVSIALAFSAISGISTSVYAADANAEEGTFERIQVTGSRIKRIGAMAQHRLLLFLALTYKERELLTLVNY